MNRHGKRTQTQHPFKRSVMSNRALIAKILDADGILPEDIDFANSCTEQMDVDERLDRQARDRLLAIARAARLVGYKPVNGRPHTTPAKRAIANGCAGYDALIASARDCLSHKPPLPRAG